MTDQDRYEEIQKIIVDAGTERHKLTLENQTLKNLLEETQRRCDYFQKMALEKSLRLIKGGKK